MSYRNTFFRFDYDILSEQNDDGKIIRYESPYNRKLGGCYWVIHPNSNRSDTSIKINFHYNILPCIVKKKEIKDLLFIEISKDQIDNFKSFCRHYAIAYGWKPYQKKWFIRKKDEYLFMPD